MPSIVIDTSVSHVLVTLSFHFFLFADWIYNFAINMSK